MSWILETHVSLLLNPSKSSPLTQQPVLMVSPSSLLINCPDILVPALKLMFSQSLTQGIFPKESSYCPYFLKSKCQIYPGKLQANLPNFMYNSL